MSKPVAPCANCGRSLPCPLVSHDGSRFCSSVCLHEYGFMPEAEYKEQPCPRCKKEFVAVGGEFGWVWAGQEYCTEICQGDAYDEYSRDYNRDHDQAAIDATGEEWECRYLNSDRGDF